MKCIQRQETAMWDSMPAGNGNEKAATHRKDERRLWRLAFVDALPLAEHVINVIHVERLKQD